MRPPAVGAQAPLASSDHPGHRRQFPKELNLDKYIDYELQFEKAFLDPLKSILDCIGWEVTKTATLDSFFN